MYALLSRHRPGPQDRLSCAHVGTRIGVRCWPGTWTCSDESRNRVTRCVRSSSQDIPDARVTHRVWVGSIASTSVAGDRKGGIGFGHISGRWSSILVNRRMRRSQLTARPGTWRDSIHPSAALPAPGTSSDLPDGLCPRTPVQPPRKKYFASVFQKYVLARLPSRLVAGAYRDRHEREAGCGGRNGA
jgi:hypothetical protein